MSCGLSAAGALPAPLQHITESIARTFGVPQPDRATPSSNGKAAGAPSADKPATHVTAPDTAPTSPAPDTAAPGTTKAPAILPKPSVSTTTPPPTTIALPDANTPIAPPRPHIPSAALTRPPIPASRRRTTARTRHPASPPTGAIRP